MIEWYDDPFFYGVLGMILGPLIMIIIDKWQKRI